MANRIPLDSLCQPKVATLPNDFDDVIDYIDISSVDNESKTIIAHQEVDAKEAPSRARQLLQVGDVIVSTVRPNLNAVALVESAYENTLVGSTGYCVLRVKDGVDNRFIFYFCQSPYFVEDMTAQATGASYPAVTASIVRKSMLPAYTLEEQHEIAQHLDTVSTLISLRKQQIAKLDELVKARFVEMFGDPVSNPKGWEMAQLSSLAEIKIGPFGSLLHKEDYVTGEHPLVNPSHIIDGQIVVDNDLTVNDTKYDEMAAYHLLPGDVVLGRRGEMGRCAVVHEPGMLCGTGSLIVRPSDKMHPYFLQKIISYPTFKKAIEDMAVGVTMMNLNVPIVSSFMIPVLPRDQQDAYLAFVAQTDQQKLTIQHSLAKLEMLKKALMQQYFG